MSSKRAMKQAQKQAYAKHRSNISNSRLRFKKRLTVWQLKNFEESYTYKIKNGISLLKKSKK